MNYILILLEVIFTFFLMFIFYKVGKKNGLYLYMVLMSSIASIIMFKTIDLFSFSGKSWYSYYYGIIYM